MSVKDRIGSWAKSKFGGTGSNLLDESVYSRKELEQDKIKLEQDLKETEKKMNKLKNKYKKLLKKGAQMDDMKKQQYAQKAKMAKKKFKMTKRKYKVNNQKLGAVIMIEGSRDLMEMQGTKDSTKIGEIIRDDNVDASKVRNKMLEEMAQYRMDIQDMQEIQEALDLPIMEGSGFDEGTTEELEKMKQIEAGKTSAESVDIEEEVETDEEIDIDEIEDEMENISL